MVLIIIAAMLFNMHSFAAGGSGKILHWSFNEQSGGFIGDSAGVHKAIAYGYERDNGCMNFSDGKIYYLSRYVAGELKGQSAFSVYARFTAEKDAEFDIFSLSGKYKVYVKDGQLRAYVNFDTVKRDISLFNVETGKETEALVSVGASRIICTYSGKTKKINIDGSNSDFLTALRCEGDTLYLKNVSINDIAVFAGERTLAQAIASIDKNAVLAADADLVGEWHFDPDESGSYPDYSGNGFFGTARNRLEEAPGVAGNSIKSFTRKCSYVDLGYELDRRFIGKGAYSVSMWVQCLYPPNVRQRIWANFMKGEQAGLHFDIGSGYILVGGRSCPEDSWQQRLYTFASYGEWHHLTAVMDYANARIRLYIDGEEQQPRSSDNPSPNIDWKSRVFIKGESPFPVEIGGDISSPYGFNGYIDEAYVLSRTPTSDEVKLMYGLHKGARSEFEIESEELREIREKTAKTAVFSIGSEDAIYNGKRLKLYPKNLDAKTVLKENTVMIPADFLNNIAGITAVSDDKEVVLKKDGITARFPFDTDGALRINGIAYIELNKAAKALKMKYERLNNGLAMLYSGERQFNIPHDSALVARLSALFAEKKYPAPKEDYASTRTVVAYSDSADKVYIRTPNIYNAGDNTFFAMHDKSQNGTETHLLKSTDGGKSWTEIHVFEKLAFSVFFEDGGAYYVMGLRGGKITVHKSTDGGYTWTEPVDSKSGILFDNRVGYTVDGAMSIAKHNGRIYKAYEDRVGPNGGLSWVKDYQAFVVSAPEGSDLLDESNWTMSNKLVYPPSVKPNDTPMVNEKGWLEGNMAVDPDGNVVDLLRFNSDPQAQPGWICVVNVSPDGKTISFDEKNGFAELNGANSRFSVKYDDKTGYYFSMVNSNTDPDLFMQRNVLRIAVSKDLKTWEILETILADESLIPWQESVRQHSFSYVDFVFDGDDIAFLVREAADNSTNFHDNNYITFYRISDYKKILQRNGIIGG